MKKLFTIILVFGLIATSLFAQSIFDKDASTFHKKAVMVCGTMKAANPTEQQVNNVIAAADAELKALTEKYKNNPPAEYKNDPLWSSYFDDFADNLTLVKTLAAQKDYKIAAKYCNTFCQIFGRMHRNNGTVDLTDVLFSLNMQMKLTTDMANAGNIASAKENIGMIKKLLEQSSNKIKNAKNLEPLFTPINKMANEWVSAIEKGNAKSANELYKKFSVDFPKLFIASM
ncbi:hypothetical protein ABRY23_00915 [Melioribacteraceae bacterium 4301-Me]|uniref:hypothetical protein n=1 Tax=Pyranulibacter aquaticus TaxID=3163344 RepID=UPI00359BB638